MSSSSLVDEETRQFILKKTWCHGQLVLPAFAVLYVWLAFFRGYNTLVFLYAAIILPAWSFYSFQAVSSSRGAVPLRPLCCGVVLVEVAHLGVLVVAAQDLSTALNMLLLVASGLFMVETAAFLGVVAFLREPTRTTNGNNYQDLQDDVPGFA